MDGFMGDPILDCIQDVVAFALVLVFAYIFFLCLYSSILC